MEQSKADFKQAALTLYAVCFDAEAVIAGDFKPQVWLVHVRPLSVFGYRCIFF